MPKRNSPGCASSNCCAACKCKGSPWGRMFLELSGVAMNAAPLVPDCLGARFGQVIDETWYNGITFVFNPEWLDQEVNINNPNNGDEAGGVQCVTQGARWFCIYELAALGGTNKVFVWAIAVVWNTIAGKFTVDVRLSCTRQDPDILDVSVQRVRYTYDGECPTGAYTETTRAFAENQNNGAFDFRNFSAVLTWAP